MNTLKLELLPEYLERLKCLENEFYMWNRYKIISEKESDNKFIKVELQYDNLSVLITHLLIINYQS